MQTPTPSPQWHIAYTYSRCEKRVDQEAKKQGLNSYLPLTVQERQWSDRIKKIETPLFPNYIFIKGTPTDVHHFQQIKEVVNFIKYDSKLATIKESEIEMIKKILNGKRNVFTESKLYKIGTKVKIKQGAFVGIEGLLVKKNNQNQFVVQIETLGQSINIDVPISYLAYQ